MFAGIDDLSQITVYVPKAAYTAYTTANGWKDLDIQTKDFYVTTGGVKYTILDSTALVSSGQSTDLSGDITIADTVTFSGVKFPVTELDKKCFQNCKQITSVDIPGTVTTIGSNAFEDCDSLTSVNIPVGVTNLSDSCFYSCESLQNIKIPSTVTKIGENCFTGCKSLTSISLPSSLQYLDSGCFSACGLKSVNIPSGVSMLQDYCFAFNDSLTTVTIPMSIRASLNIGATCFQNCPSLTTFNCGILLPPALDIDAFKGNDLTQMQVVVPATTIDIYKTTDVWKDLNLVADKNPKNLVIADSVIYEVNTLFGNAAVIGTISTNLAGDLVILDTLFFNKQKCAVKSIEDGSFKNCTLLTSVEIPASITRIKYESFAGCSSLTNVNYLGGLAWAKPDCFFGCTSLESIHISGFGFTWDREEGEMSTDYLDAAVTFYVSAEFYSAYKHINNENWQGKNIACLSWKKTTIVDGVEYALTEDGKLHIVSYTDEFQGDASIVTDLEELSTDSKVTRLNDYCFYDSEIKNVNIPEGITEIGSGSFTLRNNLSTLTLPASVDTIGELWIVSSKDSLKYITCLAVNPPAHQQNSTDEAIATGIKLYVPGEAVEAYKADEYWKFFDIEAIGTTAGIEAVAQETENTETVIYDFQGRRVLNPRTGKAYIVNGKKTIWK